MRGDGGIYRRGGVWWVAYYHRGQRVRESAHTIDEEKARKFLRKKTKKANTSEFVNQPSSASWSPTWPSSYSPTTA